MKQGVERKPLKTEAFRNKGATTLGHLIDLTGQTFGEWTVIKRVNLEDKKRVHWLCRCSCGKETDVLSNNLRSGRSKSCGHVMQLEEVRSKCGVPPMDLTGQTFGTLTVLGKGGKSSDGETMWVCKCSCGKTVEVRGTSLRRGATRSCGHYCTKYMKRHPEYDLTGQTFGELTVIKQVPNPNNRNSKWLCRCSCGREVAVFGLCLKNGNTRSCGCRGKRKLEEVK